MNKLSEYFSPKGAYSRGELLLATVVLLTLAILFAQLRIHNPGTISDGTYRLMIYSLYPIWGAALGKRSRDLGTTFTYGMLIGMIFPVMGVVFLFQRGKK